jgi:hypothetical protein
VPQVPRSGHEDKQEKKEGMNYVHQVRESKRSDHINAPNVKIGADGFRQRKKKSSKRLAVS